MCGRTDGPSLRTTTRHRTHVITLFLLQLCVAREKSGAIIEIKLSRYYTLEEILLTLAAAAAFVAVAASASSAASAASASVERPASAAAQ